MTKVQKNFLLKLTDDARHASQKHKYCKKRIVGHVVVFANEPVPEEFAKKEVWLLDLKNGDHLKNECVWHFPAEPPTKRAQIGKVGVVANPYSLDDPDPEKAEAARMLQQWQRDSRRVYGIEDLPTPKRVKVNAALSPESKEALDSLLRKASFSDGPR